jgi:two-component sensor histidine kinase
MLRLIVDMATQVMEAKACSLMLLDEERNELRLHAAQGFDPGYRQISPLKMGEGIAGQVAQTGQPMIVENVLTDPRYPYGDVARQEGFCSLICVPLRVRERSIGAFSSYTGEPHAFTSQEIELFQTLANQTALAIENSHLILNTAVVREMHHRVKNNLQTIAMVLRLQIGESPHVEAREPLQDSINRILSIAAVHEALSDRGFRLADVKQVLRQVAQTVAQNRLHPSKNLCVEVRGDEISLPSRAATALTMAVNELIQNALKHAFVGREEGRITITLRHRPPAFKVEVQDDGMGLSGAGPRPSSLGLQIVETLVGEDLGGELNIESGEHGTCATIVIPNASGIVRPIRTRESPE